MSVYQSAPAYVYLVQRTDDGLEFIEPSVSVTPLTGEAPHGFDGGYCHKTPKFPAILITEINNKFRHVPNALVLDKADLDEWRKRYSAMKVSKFEIL